MSYCGIDDSDALFMVTPVENLFIQEFLPNAPADYVKVYLFALMQSTYPQLACKNISRFAADINMSEDKVQKAVRYWCSRRLMIRTDGGFLMRGARSAISDGVETGGGMMFEPELINRVNELVDDLNVKSRVYKLLGEVYEFCDFDPDAAVAFLTYSKKYCVNKDGTLSSRRMENLLMEWRRRDITTAESARRFLLERDIERSDANEVLVHIGIAYRKVTLDEYRLYEKWTGEMGFTLDAVKEACAGMTAARNPNFLYLDTMLTKLYKRGLVKAAAIRADRNETDAEKKRVQSCNYILGVTGIVTEEQRKYLRRWSNDYSLADEEIFDLCREAHSNGLCNYKGAETFINSYVMKRGNDGAPDGVREDARLDEFVRRVLLEAGTPRASAPSDKKAAQRWLADFSEEMILLAAKKAAGVQKPGPYISAVLDGWKKDGVDTAEKAAAQKPAQTGKPVRKKERDYSEREYKDSDFDDLYD